MAIIRDMTDQDHSMVLAIAARLPEWFDERAVGIAIPADLRHHRGFVAESRGQVVGFITLYVADGRLNIGWLGVDKPHQRQGIGSRLIARAEQAAAEMGLAELATWTVGDSVDYPPYQGTRAFYRKQGFEVYQTLRTDSPSCPEELRVSKRIAQPGNPADCVRPAASRRSPPGG